MYSSKQEKLKEDIQMSRGFVEVMVHQKMVLDKIPEKDKVLTKEIFELTAEMGVTRAYPLLHGWGIGFFLSLLIIHIFYSAKALSETSSLLLFGLWAVCTAVIAWLLYRFHYRPKYLRLSSEFQNRLENDQNFKRVHELIKTIGKEVQKVQF